MCINTAIVFVQIFQLSSWLLAFSFSTRYLCVESEWNIANFQGIFISQPYELYQLRKILQKYKKD